MNDNGNITPNNARTRLIEGNRRFAGGVSEHPHTTPDRLPAVRTGQAPFAAIITCSDSRTPPEIIFDCGIGDLFVIRTAGNTLDRAGWGSLVYAAVHLGCPLALVLGHESCGAVNAALMTDEDVAREPADIRELIDTLRANIPRSMVRRTAPGFDPDEAARENAETETERIRHHADIAGRIAHGELAVVAGMYSFDTGRVAPLG